MLLPGPSCRGVQWTTPHYTYIGFQTGHPLEGPGRFPSFYDLHVTVLHEISVEGTWREDIDDGTEIEKAHLHEMGPS